MRTRRNRTSGLARVDALVVALVCLFLLAVLPLMGTQARSDAARTRCAANLAEIGRAMLVYANDYDGRLPRSGGPTTRWGQTANWMAPNRYWAFGLDRTEGSGGAASISSNFYLLVKYAGVSPKTFVCPGDEAITEFKLSDMPHLLPEGFELTHAWDFGWALEAPKHCAYAYHHPFGRHALTTSDEPGKAVAADRNPWLLAKPFSLFKPDIPPWNGSTEQGRKGNSIAHGEDGQNVLFLDGHVAFEERAYCGLDMDNIYTISDAATTGSPLGVVPPLGQFATPNRRDSVLIQDPVDYDYETTRTYETPSIDSNELERTAILATLDCPAPKHRNVIWCAAFQMAWDKLKNDIIGEPIEVRGAEELADRLNDAEFTTSAIDEGAYYATAGFVKDGIIDQILHDMAQRFPGEPVPPFKPEHHTLPDVVVAYAFLSVDARFKHPFYLHLRAFDFEDSQGTKTPVSAFCGQSPEPDPASKDVREQVEILSYVYGQTRDTAEFVVDPSKHTEPYQVILARVPRSGTLRQTVAYVEKRIADFKHDPDYETLRRLRPIDRLIAPDVLYRLKHSYRELLRKFLGNPGWEQHFIFEAMQIIDFSLSRTGAVVKSHARMGLASGMRAPPPRDIQKPRHLYFDRPFLIVVKKRQPSAVPFFVMWVDNTELMKPH